MSAVKSEPTVFTVKTEAGSEVSLAPAPVTSQASAPTLLSWPSGAYTPTFQVQVGVTLLLTRLTLRIFSLGATASTVRLPASKLRQRHEQPVDDAAGPAASAVHHCSPGPDTADRADRHPIRGCLVTIIAIIQSFLCPVLLPLKQRPVYFLSIKLYLVAAHFN